MSPILVTGCAGFIGFHVTRRLLEQGRPVVGIDSLSNYYNVSLKRDRIAQLEFPQLFQFARLDLADRDEARRLFDAHSFESVIHLAAQAGVRYSIDHPESYIDSNLTAFGNILEGCRHGDVSHLLYASSSSVYGANRTSPFSTHHRTDQPISLYAATKRANELMAYTYSSLFGLPTTGMRFFTVYGPWGRPDMALFRFTSAMLEGREIDLYNFGDMRRDFTYIDDVVEAVVRLFEQGAAWKPLICADSSEARGDRQVPWRLLNVASGRPMSLGEMVASLEKHLGLPAKRQLLPLQPGDIRETSADIEPLAQEIGYRPKVHLDEGIRRFVEWYLHYHKIEHPAARSVSEKKGTRTS